MKISRKAYDDALSDTKGLGSIEVMQQLLSARDEDEQIIVYEIDGTEFLAQSNRDGSWVTTPIGPPAD